MYYLHLVFSKNELLYTDSDFWVLIRDYENNLYQKLGIMFFREEKKKKTFIAIISTMTIL